MRTVPQPDLAVGSHAGAGLTLRHYAAFKVLLWHLMRTNQPRKSSV